MSKPVEQNRVLVVGKAAVGKSYSLEGLDNPEKVFYFNCETGKRLPFPSKFQRVIITDPMQVMPYLEQIKLHPDKVETIVFDSLTFLMDMYENQYVNTSADTRKAWVTYKTYIDNLLQVIIPNMPQKNIIYIAHTADIYNESEMVKEVKVKLKGSIMNKGLESYFTDVVAVKKVPLKELSNYSNDLLHITEDDEIMGYKHCIQTKLTKDTVNESIRGTLFKRNETYIDGNIQLVLDRMTEVYGE